MAFSGAARSSTPCRPGPSTPPALVVGVLFLAAAYVFLLLAGTEDMTASITALRRGITTDSESLHSKTHTRRQPPDCPVSTQGQIVPTATVQVWTINRPWLSSEASARATPHPTADRAPARWDVRQDLLDIAAAQRGHWTPRTATPVRDRADADDRIADALYRSRAP
jgi:hypothetical protein